MTTTASAPSTSRIRVPHFVRGELVWGDDEEYQSRDFGVPFVTPKLEFDRIIPPRTELGPAFDVPLTEIIDYLVEVGSRLVLEQNEHLQESLEMTLQVSSLPRRIIEGTFRRPGEFLNRELLEYRIARTFPDPRMLDDWVEYTDPRGNVSRVRAFPPRLVHMLAGNSPSGAMMSIADAALTKGVHLFKMPSADPFTAVAVLRTMADVDPDHPVLRSMSAVYWRGGDTRVENVVYRSQYFDKLVAWGGGDAIEHVLKFTGPGFHLVAFDPKVSMSIVGREAFASDDVLREVAEATAADVMIYNQDACVAPRHVFVEGDVDDVDRFCEELCDRLGVERPTGSAVGPKPPTDLREAVDGVRFLEPEYRIWGDFDGRGMVLRSPEPVDFHLSHKTVNVVPVPSMVEATRNATVATQTVGVYPMQRKAEVRDLLATAGVQRVVRLGNCHIGSIGGPHDGMYPLHRFMNWVVDDDA